ncbi:hypothetical protein D3C85_1479500 [compost metagenome]
MEAKPMLRVARKVASGLFRVKRTCWSSTLSMLLIRPGSCMDWACGKPLWATLCQGLAGSSMRWKLKTTSSALSGRLGLK